MAAPFAHFDDEWQGLNEFKIVSEQGIQNDRVNRKVEEVTQVPEDLPELHNSFSGEIGTFKSMEDLVNDFDKKLSVCLRNYYTKTDIIAPVNLITEDTVLKRDE